MATLANASQDPWELAKSRFLDDLEPHEKELFNNATLENIYYSTSNINRDDAENSKTRAVVRKLGPLVSAIESYGGAFDTLAQISPQYLSPIWGSIRVLLVVASSHSKFYDKIVDTLGRIGDILPRFRDYERIYNGQKHIRLYQALSNAYLEIIALCREFRKSIREQKTSKVRRLLKPLSPDKQFDEVIERFRILRQNVEDEARTCHMIEAAEHRGAQLVLLAEERRRKLLARLSKVDSKRRHRKLKGSRHEGTGLWFTSTAEYEEWLAALKSSVLCCYGIPGCGKSVLVSSVIDSFNARGTLLFYYCDYADKRTLEPSNVFTTLARQALEKVEVLPETLASEIERADHDGERLTDPTKALVLLQKSLELVPGPIYLILDGLDEATESSQTFLCNKLKHLIQTSAIPVKLFITGREDLQSVLTLDPNIPFSRIPISSTAISLDIENYVRASTRRRILDGLLVIRDPGLEQLIVNELVIGAKGMFLWVEFQLHDLCEPESDYGIRLVLQNLPPSLGETYERLLNKIEGAERKYMIQRMFKWIVCAREPIHVEELREAVAFSLEDRVYDSQKLLTDLNRLVRASGNLVVINEETQVVQLAHHTVQQYLLQQDGCPFQFTIKDANVMAGEFCIAYLSFSDLKSQITRYADNKNTDMLALGKIASRGQILLPDHPGQKVVRVWNTFRSHRSNALDINMTRYVPQQRKAWQPANFAFLPYVVTHWLWHAISFDVSVDVDAGQQNRRDRLFKDLILGKHLLFEFRPWGEFNRDTQESSAISLLGWALMANYRYLIQMASSNIALPSFVNVWNATCNNYSWANGRWSRFHEFTPYHLSTLDRDYDSSDTLDSPNLVWLFSRLWWACKNGHIDAIRECKLMDADPSMPDQLNTMIQYLVVAAAACGELEVVKHLWSKAIVPFKDGKEVLVISDLTKGAALAAIAGHSDVVSYLADEGSRPSEIFFSVGLFQQFLCEAISDNNVGIVESLLVLQRLRIDMNDVRLRLPISDQNLSNTLVKAIGDSNEELARLLLEQGIDLNAPDEDGWTPLMKAIFCSQDSIVSMLLERDCFLGNTSFGSPLTVAACLGNFSLARELVLQGAEIFGETAESENLMGRPCIDILSTYAGGSSHRASHTVRLSPTPLYMACYHGSLDIVKLLLSYGAAANYPSPSSLFYLEQRQLDPIVFNYTSDWRLKILAEIQSVPATNRKSGPMAKPSWELPITAAITMGHEPIVSILLSSGALWPNEFDALYASCFGSISSQQEELSKLLANSVRSGSLAETNHIRNQRTEMRVPANPASYVRSVRELQILDVGKTKLQQERPHPRISKLQDEIKKSHLSCPDLLQAALIRAAQNCENDLVQDLIRAGASLLSPDTDGVLVPDPSLVVCAGHGNTALRNAFLDIGLSAVISYFDKTKNIGTFEELLRRQSSLQRIITTTALFMDPRRTFDDALHFYNIMAKFPITDFAGNPLKELYKTFMFSYTTSNPLESAICCCRALCARFGLSFVRLRSDD